MPTSRVARAFLLLSDLFLCFTCDGSLDLLSSTEGEIRRIPCLVVLIGLLLMVRFTLRIDPMPWGECVDFELRSIC